jgi:hypothetical protein
MNETQFERLLFEEESTTLDFKKEQYRFVKSTENEKSELLKDIVGFANAWRRSEAFILIGVQDVRGGRANIIGIPAEDHLDDHSLQQFVNSLTNRPVHFGYEAFGFENKQVGIIRIEQQHRPIFLKRDYGILQKNEVYVRRGSSTDPTKPAQPDEIAQMGNNSAPQEAELVVEFADTDGDDSLGTRIAWDAQFCEMPPTKSIPDFEFPEQPIPGLGIDLSRLHHSFPWMGQPNRDYYRELANYVFAKRLLRPVRIMVKNIGQVAATSVRVELIVPGNIGVHVAYPSDIPERPKCTSNLSDYSGLGNIRSAFQPAPGEISIDKNEERFLIEVECGIMQPGRRVRSETIYVGKKDTGDLLLTGQIFAGNLPQPRDFSLFASVNMTQSRVSLAELENLTD